MTAYKHAHTSVQKEEEKKRDLCAFVCGGLLSVTQQGSIVVKTHILYGGEPRSGTAYTNTFFV